MKLLVIEEQKKKEIEKEKFNEYIRIKNFQEKEKQELARKEAQVCKVVLYNINTHECKCKCKCKCTFMHYVS